MNRFIEKLSDVIKHILVVLLIALVLVVSYIALMRNVFKKSPAWGESMALTIMVWFCLLSAAVGVIKNIHIRMTVLDGHISDKAMRRLEFLTINLWLIFGILSVIHGIKLTNLAGNNIIAGINLPASVIYSSIPVFGIIVSLAALDQEVNLWKQA